MVSDTVKDLSGLPAEPATEGIAQAPFNIEEEPC